MSTEEKAPDAEGTAPRRKLPVVPIAVVLAALAAGGAGGYFAAGPMLVRHAFAGGVPAAPASAHPESESAESDHGVPKPPAPQYLIENVIVNPAGSQGTRFVLLTLAIEARDTTAVALMKQRDAEIRDAVIGMLGAESVESLSDISRREQLKDSIRSRVVALLPAGSVGKLYVPQFVLQ